MACTGLSAIGLCALTILMGTVSGHRSDDGIRSPRRVRVVSRFGPLVAVLAALAAGSCADSSLPPLPEINLSSFAPAVREQIAKAAASAADSPRDPMRVGELGRLLYAYGQHGAAATCFERSARLDGDSFEWPYLLGVARTDMGLLEEALEALNIASRIRPASTAAAIRRSDLLEQAGDASSAIEILLDAQQTSRDIPGVHYRLGRLYAPTDPVKAIDHLRTALAEEPEYREALYALATSLRSIGEEEEANVQMALYAKADSTQRRHYPDPVLDAMASVRGGSAQEAFERARALQDEGDADGARAVYLEVLEIDPDYVQAHVNLIAVLGELGVVDLAENHFQKAVALNPSISEAYYNVGLLRNRAGDHDGAIKAYEEAVRLNPQNADALTNLGAALDVLGRNKDAELRLREALRHSPAHPFANYHLGRRLAEAGHYRQALPYLEAAIKTATHGTPLHAFLLALVHRELGNHAQAQQYAAQARDGARSIGNAVLMQRIAAAFGP